MAFLLTKYRWSQKDFARVLCTKVVMQLRQTKRKQIYESVDRTERKRELYRP